MMDLGWNEPSPFLLSLTAMPGKAPSFKKQSMPDVSRPLYRHDRIDSR